MYHFTLQISAVGTQDGTWLKLETWNAIVTTISAASQGVH